MAAILQHVPRFIDAEPETALFTSIDELLAIPWIARFRDDPEWGSFYRFSTHGAYLMCEFRKGASWIKVGTMAGADDLVTSLPRWVRLADHDES